MGILTSAPITVRIALMIPIAFPASAPVIMIRKLRDFVNYTWSTEGKIKKSTNIRSLLFTLKTSASAFPISLLNISMSLFRPQMTFKRSIPQYQCQLQHQDQPSPQRRHR
jgi:hypothetical protein